MLPRLSRPTEPMQRAVRPTVAAIVPALDEEGSIEGVVTGLLRAGIATVIVADNGSTDATARIAKDAGAMVVSASRRGYGSACLAGLAALPRETSVVLFCDGDGADDLDSIPALLEPILGRRADLVIGSRALGTSDRGALTLPQRAGNWVAAVMLGLLFTAQVTDLGPFRAVSTAALSQLQMSDPSFGWTAEMQTKALRLGLKVVEVPVRARVRTAGQSKISGRPLPVLLAGYGILSTILRYRFMPLAKEAPARQPESFS